jgi:signal transduction histidine kinase
MERILGPQSSEKDVPASSRSKSTQSRGRLNEQAVLNYADLPVPCCRVDDTAFISDCNELLAGIVGSSRDELIQTSLLDLVDASSLPAVEKILTSFGNENMQSGNIATETVQLRRKDCSVTFPASLHIRPIQNKFGRSVACNIAIMDQTLTQKIIQQAKRDNDELVRKEKIKDEFVTVASHELKTPIQPLLGYAVLAKKKLITEEKAWDGVLREARKLQQLANDILDASKIEGGNLKLNIRKEKINLILTSLADSVRNELEKHITLSVRYDETDAGLEVELDRSRIGQVVINLLSNSIKFTQKGSITIESKSFPAQNKIEIRVSDTGKGISDEIMPHLFEKFATKGHGNVQNNKGTGLGLYISKAIVKEHKGELSAFNNDVEGATFLISLPISQTQQEATDSEALNSRGMSLVSKQDLKAAFDCFEQATKLNPNNSKAWYNKGMSLMNMGESKEEALQCFHKAIEINPLDAEGWHNKGTILVMLGKNSEALTCYDRALELKPGYARAWQNKGHLLAKMGNKKGAKECFKNSVEAGLS